MMAPALPLLHAGDAAGASFPPGDLAAASLVLAVLAVAGWGLHRLVQRRRREP